MDPVVRPAAGVFRALTHAVEAGARPIDFRGIPLWFAQCGAAAVLVNSDEIPTLDVCHCGCELHWRDL